MKKLILASAVSALFAAPATVLAQAKPAPVPTLDKILEASGISVSGYIDAGYTHADKNVETAFSTRVFDSQNSSFLLHQFGITVAKQPKEGFGGLVNLTVGKDANVIQSFPGTANATFDVTQGFVQYAGGPLTVIAGKFVTLSGTEVIASSGNNNISRSILFGAIPFTHTGVRATWALSDTFSLIAGVNNGWDQLQDANKGKTAELGASLNPIKPLTISLSAYSGKEVVTPGGAAVPEGTRTSINAVASYTIIDPLSVGLEILNVSQDNTVTGNAKGKYTGVAGYIAYMITPKFRAAGRVESFDDKDGIRFGTPNGFAKNKYREVTITGAFVASDSFEARVEARRDQANNTVFTDFTGAQSKTLTTLALQGLYKF